jgi:signal transduction histidine kinase
MLLVLLTSYLAVRTSPGGAGVSEWWVASGIGACVMVTSPRRHVPWLFLGVLGLSWAGNLLGGRAPETGPWLGLGNAVESYVIAVLLTRNWSRAPSLYSWPDLRRYFVVVALGSAAPALMAVALSFSLLDRSFSVVAMWVFINHLGCNLVLMLLVTSRPPTPQLTRTEVTAHIAVLVAAVAITYAPSNSQSVAFLLTPLAVWAGSRFPSRWAVLELIALGGLITAFAQVDVGPFEVLAVDASLVSVLAGMQSFMATSVLIALVFATALALERERGLAMVAQQREVEVATSVALEREREANVRMQSMDRAKNELISTISHELRTPLTSIVGYVELLEDGADLGDDRRVDLLARVSRNADRLLGLAEDVLRIAAVDEEEWVPDLRLIDLRECVLAAQDAAVVPASRHEDLKVVVEVPDQPVPVHADAAEIERVVFNFVSNAIKFSPGPGTVRVWLATLGATARISVEDTGLGISRVEQQRIFERFFRTAIARQRAVPGTGLGLSINRSIAEAHGGTVGFLSEEGAGSTFWVDLPIAPGTAPG